MAAVKQKVYKETIFATDKQKDYIRCLLIDLGLYSRAGSKYSHLPLWMAAKMITKLKGQLDEQRELSKKQYQAKVREKRSRMGSQVSMIF